MKLGATTDNHLQANLLKVGNLKQVHRMMFHLMHQDTKAFLVLGDIGNGTHVQPRLDVGIFSPLMDTHPETLYVLGNHDLWRPKKHIEPPNIALRLNQAMFPKSAKLLEPSWYNEDTMHIIDDHVFVGTLGWCDFQHPGLRHMRAYYSHKDVCPINDMDYVQLGHKWPEYVDALNHAFMQRLRKAVRIPGITNVVMLIHTPCFPSHSLENPGSLVWAYFYNFKLGQDILYLARDYPELKFWCLAGHAHNFCRGVWGLEAENLYTYGLKTTMDEQSLLVFDTDMDIEELRNVAPMRFVGGETKRKLKVFNQGM